MRAPGWTAGTSPATCGQTAAVPGDEMKLLYFAWLRARIGHAEEIFQKPAEVNDVAGLLEWLRDRGPLHAEALRDLSVVRVAVNQEYVGPNHPIREGDEIAIFPPVTGGEPKGAKMIRVQREDFDIGRELDRLARGDHSIGGVASFVGLVRDMGGPDRVSALTLEHYPGMTEKKLAEIEAEANRRWPLSASLIIHRYGRLEPGDRIVLVATASPHREAALAACHFLIDWLKTDAPFWKSEETPAASAGSRPVPRTTRQPSAGVGQAIISIEIILRSRRVLISPAIWLGWYRGEAGCRFAAKAAKDQRADKVCRADKRHCEERRAEAISLRHALSRLRRFACDDRLRADQRNPLGDQPCRSVLSASGSWGGRWPRI